jgi:16S rRNA (uracil1498-N3)-methyltransferase
MAVEKTKSGKARSVRLYVEAPLVGGGEVLLTSAQAHYLAKVMRFKPGDTLSVFNGRDGEWRAAQGANRAMLTVEEQIKPQGVAVGPTLLFAPLKAARNTFLIEKSVELGVGALQPVTTQHGQIGKIHLARTHAQATEAAEQCGRLEVPLLRPLVPLSRALADWPAGRRLMFCDESGGPPALGALADADPAADWAILIGPEGGFSPREREMVLARPETLAVSLGPRILRAETAAIAALALWQAALGDLRAGDCGTIS